jgi:site-specific DNA-cytosine methylase
VSKHTPVHFLDLFAGIGGFALGAKWAGLKFDKHYFSEVDPYAISVYRKRFPG